MAKTTKRSRSEAAKKAAATRQANAAKKPDAAKPEPPKIATMPTAGPKIVEFEYKLDETLNETADTPKRGRGRPRKEPTPEPPTGLPENAIAMVVNLPFDLWAKSQGVSELSLTDEEARAIAEPIKVLLDHYVPQIPTIAAAWLSFAVVAYGILSPRLDLIQKIKEDKAAAESGAAAAGSGVESIGFPTAIKTEAV